MDTDIYPLLLVTLLAAATPVLARRARPVRLPIVVVEILAGMIIGKSGLDLVDESQSLDFLADFGFTYLMFLSGLEMDFSQMKGAAAAPRPVYTRLWFLALASFLGTLFLAQGAGFCMSHIGWTKNPVLMGLILSTTSLGIVVPVIKERGITLSPYGQLLLTAALIGDFATLVFLSLQVAFLSQGPSPELLMVLPLLAAFVLAASLAQRVRRIPLLSWTLEELSHATSQIRVRGAFAVMVAWVFLAEEMGSEAILGAFLAGVLISLMAGKNEEPHRLKLESFGYGFFIPIFFIRVGMNFDLAALTQHPGQLWAVPGIILAAYAVKIVPALIFRLRFSWRETLAGGFLLSSRLSLIIAAASIALGMGAISAAVHSQLILVAVVTCTLSPILFGRLAGQVREEERRGVIVAGRGDLAQLVEDRLARTGEKVARLGGSSEPVTGPDKVPFWGIGALEEAGAAKARTLMVLEDDPGARLEVCRLAREEFGLPEVVALVQRPGEAEALERLGVRVVESFMATALALEGALHFPAAFQMLTDLDHGVELLEAGMYNRALEGAPLCRVCLPGGVLVVSVNREGEYLVPGGDTRLRLGDRVTLVGPPDIIHEARSLLESGFLR